MTAVALSDWLANRWIVQHSATQQEMAELFAVVDRDLADAAIPGLSADWRLGIAYNAALQLGTIALAAEGYRAGRERHHERTILSLQQTAGIAAATVDVLDVTRRKRNQANYGAAGATSVREAEELYKVVQTLRSDVVHWMRKRHAALCPPNVKP